MNIIDRKAHKFNTRHLKCFPGFLQQLENLVFVEFPRFLFIFFLNFKTEQNRKQNRLILLETIDTSVIVRNHSKSKVSHKLLGAKN